MVKGNGSIYSNADGRIVENKEGILMNGKWVKASDYNFGDMENGKYYVVVGKRNPFSQEYLMIARKEKNGLVNPVMEQYITEISQIYTEPFIMPK